MKFPRNETYLHQVFEAARITEARDAAALLAALLKQLERTLLGYIAELTELEDGLLASGLLAAGDDTTALGLDKIFLVETTGSVLGSAVEDLSLGPDSLLRAAHHSGIVLARVAAVLAGSTTSICHFFLIETQKKSASNLENEEQLQDNSCCSSYCSTWSICIQAPIYTGIRRKRLR